MQAKGRALLDELDAAGGTDGRGGGDPAKLIAVVQKILQAANASPQELYTALPSILKTSYFQTGVKALRVMSYSLLQQCREAWHESSGEWDNVVGSMLKDIESPDAELQLAALRALCFVPVAKMSVHLEKGRIRLIPCLTSASAPVRRQAVATIAHLMCVKFTAKQIKFFSPEWVGSVTRILWTDSDPLVASTAAGLLRFACYACEGGEDRFPHFYARMSSPAHCDWPRGPSERFAPVVETMMNEFVTFPQSLALVVDRVRLLMNAPDTSSLNFLFPLAVAVAKRAQDCDPAKAPLLRTWYVSSVLTPRFSDAYGNAVMVEAAKATLYLSQSDEAVAHASGLLLSVAPESSLAMLRDPPLEALLRVCPHLENVPSRELTAAFARSFRGVLARIDSELKEEPALSMIEDNVLIVQKRILLPAYVVEVWKSDEPSAVSLKRFLALGLFLATRDAFPPASMPAKAAAVCVAASECFRWPRVVRSAYASLLGDAFSRLPANVAEALAAKCITLEEGSIESRVSLTAAALFWPKDRLHEVVRSVTVNIEHLKRKDIPVTAASAAGAPLGLKSPLHSVSAMSDIRSSSNRVGGSSTTGGGGAAAVVAAEGPVDALAFLLLVCGKRSPQSGALQALGSLMDACESDPAIQSTVMLAVSLLETSLVNTIPLSFPHFSPFTPVPSFEPFAANSPDAVALGLILNETSFPARFDAKLQQMVVRQRQGFQQAWVRVSPDSSPVTVECNSIVNPVERHVSVFVRVTNSSTIRLQSVKIGLAYPPLLKLLQPLPGSNQLFFLVPDMSAGYIATFGAGFSFEHVLHLCPLTFCAEISFVGASVVPSGGQVGAIAGRLGRCYHCAVYLAPPMWTVAPLALSTPLFGHLWTKLGVSTSTAMRVAVRLEDFAASFRFDASAVGTFMPLHSVMSSATSTAVRLLVAGVFTFSMSPVLARITAERAPQDGSNNAVIVHVETHTNDGKSLRTLTELGGVLALLNLRIEKNLTLKEACE